MKYVFLAFAIVLQMAVSAAAQNQSQRGRVADGPPPAPYTRADFVRDCIAIAPDSQPARREWIAKCKSREAP
jgi:hypothetical protein